MVTLVQLGELAQRTRCAVTLLLVALAETQNQIVSRSHTCAPLQIKWQRANSFYAALGHCGDLVFVISTARICTFTQVCSTTDIYVEHKS